MFLPHLIPPSVCLLLWFVFCDDDNWTDTNNNKQEGQSASSSSSGVSDHVHSSLLFLTKMGGGASKEASYALVWDVKTAEQHYKEVESRTPANLNKGLTVSAMVSKKKGNGSQFFQIDQDEPAKPPKKLRKGQSMIAIGKTQNANINMVNNLKRGNSEMALARRNTDMSLMKLENKGAQPGSKGGKVMMSARLPWLVKEAKIQSGNTTAIL